MRDSFAHLFVGGGGTDLETVLIAVGIVCLGLAFLVQKSVDRRISIALIVLGAIGVAAAFLVPGSKNPPVSGPSITVQGQKYAIADIEKAMGDLCHARSVAVTDPEAARDDFLDAHTPLHVIAAALEEDDNRKAEARLLEVTVAVEDDLQKDSLGPDFPDHIVAVADEAERAVKVLAHERNVQIEVVVC
ncbi:MAG TPA: hypothetical protein VFK89_01075 [Actinomycetota bacterium]|nr:hypothetical protein [Actinomycetota bacterium]